MSRLLQIVATLALFLAANTAHAQTVFASGVTEASDITQLADGRVLVASGSSTIVAFNADGTGRADFATGLSFPSGITQLADGRVLVGSGLKVVAFNADGTGRTDFAANLVGGVTDITQLADGRVLVTVGNRITSINADGSGRITFASGLTEADGVTQLADGRVLVGSEFAGNVLVFNADGTGRADFATGLGAIFNITQLDDDRILIARVYDVDVFIPNGSSRGTFGSGFQVPYDITQHTDGRVLVTDFVAGTVLAFDPATTATEPTASLPSGFELGAAYPNPFNPSTAVPFTLAQNGDVRLAVFDALGREVAVLAEGRMAAGSHSATFDAADLPSGAYLVRLSVEGAAQEQTVTLLK